MKTAIRTLLKDVDDMPVIYFENLDNDKEAEMYKMSIGRLQSSITDGSSGYID